MKLDYSFSHSTQEPENSVLYIVATPIGNLEDISSRALKILGNVSIIACEDTRQTKKIMNKFAIKNYLISFNKHNSFKKIPFIINSLKEGNSIALVSDAGLPGICDPGEDLVKEAKVNNLKIISIPGPCAALTALVTSGIPSSKFIFEGFLPKKKKERNRILLEISNYEKTTILYESPYRINQLIRELKHYCGGDRLIQVSRELTKKFEENIFNNVDNVISMLDGKENLGEFTVIIKGIEKINDKDIDIKYLKKELYELIKAGLSLSAASKYLAKKTNISKSIIYNLH